jgi:hypothetical protein
MGKTFSIVGMEEQSGIGVEHASESNIHDEPNMEGFHRIDRTRWAELMDLLQSIAKLQRAATRARIEARQKRREATFKRQDVWIWDAKFMGEIQKLNAQGKLQGFEELSRLAAECQASRDLLGPLEQDSIEAESRWQGQIWKLKEVEEELYTDFEDEFRDAAEYVKTQGGEETSTQPFSDSETRPSVFSAVNDENEKTEVATLPIINLNDAEVESPVPLDSIYGDMQDFGDAASWSDLDSGFEDIDSIIGTSPLQANNYGLPKAILKSRRSGIQLYHELLEDFSTRRERVNKWLENNALESRLESLSLYSILQDLLELENQKVPSNWANLVVAYWDLDEASLPVSEREHYERDHGTAVKNAQPNNSSSKGGHEQESLITTETASHMLPNIQLEKQISSSRSNEDKSTNIFSDIGLAPPTPIPPSPPNSNSNSRSTSRDTRGEGRLP